MVLGCPSLQPQGVGVSPRLAPQPPANSPCRAQTVQAALLRFTWSYPPTPCNVAERDTPKTMKLIILMAP